VFDYTLPDGTLLYQQNRYELSAMLTPTKKRPKKRFLPHRKVNGHDVFGAGERRVIFNWPAVMRAGPGTAIAITEGEKNAEALIKAGLLATTVLSHKWTSECVAALTGCHGFILEDHDDDGRKLSAIARKLLTPIAASIRIVPTAHLWKHLKSPPREIELKDDVENWIKAGGDPAELFDICREIPARNDFGAISLTIEEWLSRQLPPLDPLIGNMLSTTTRALLSAPTGIGKTNFGMALWGHAGLGRNFLHWHVPRRCRMLFLDGEMSRRLLRERIEALTQHLNAKPEWALFFNKEDIEDFAPLNTGEGQAAVWKLIEEVERRLDGPLDAICFDNIVSLLVGDMKEEDAWRDTMPLIHALTKRRIGQLWLHHTGHDISRGYGTKTREWQLDLVLHMTEVKRDDSDVSFTLSFPKARERTPDNRNDFTEVNVALVDNRWVGATATADKEKASPLARRFFEALQTAAHSSALNRADGCAFRHVRNRVWGPL